MSTTDALRAKARTALASARSIVAFSGAGLSAESNVPTFRDAATGGHWTRHDPMRLASPEGFAEDPAIVLSWYAERRRGVAAAQPNAAHRALASRPHILQVTQNVDDLLERAGCAPAQVVHLHGTLGIDRCHAACGYTVPVDLAGATGQPTTCPGCGAPMRPGVVWFGESLPEAAWTRAQEAIERCDALLVIGTSAEVWPAAGLIDVARSAGAVVIVVNPNASAASGRATIELRGRAGEVVPGLLS